MCRHSLPPPISTTFPDAQPGYGGTGSGRTDDDHIRVHEAISFQDISDATGLDYGAIRTLNAGF
ncbi:MAG: hypothetical protein IPM98_04065 [Lewinellaceae bacterium]|nr:hypothetical protein [Lewinellaceae bacterium]